MLLAYDDEGPGPVVVLLHGFPLGRSMWENQVLGVGRTYRLILPDLRGHGGSAVPEGPYTIDAMADDVVETLDTLGIAEPAVLGGLSMGGYVALALATRYPERWRGLMLMDTRATADTPEAARGRDELAQKVLAARSAEPVVAAMLPKLFSPITHQRRGYLVTRVQQRMLRTHPVGVAGALRAMAARPDRTGDLARLAMPTLVLVGADDVLTPPAEAQRMAQGLPNAELVEVPEAGHLAPLENPGPVNDSMLRFLQSLG